MSSPDPSSTSWNNSAPGKSLQRKIPVLAVWLRDLIISLAISAFIIIFLYQPVKVEGTSMMPSLDDQERIFVNKFVYRWEPIERGDIVVFRYPRDPSKSYIKRRFSCEHPCLPWEKRKKGLSRGAAAEASPGRKPLGNART